MLVVSTCYNGYCENDIRVFGMHFILKSMAPRSGSNVLLPYIILTTTDISHGNVTPPDYSESVPTVAHKAHALTHAFQTFN